MLFVLLHEAAHATVSQMQVPAPPARRMPPIPSPSATRQIELRIFGSRAPGIGEGLVHVDQRNRENGDPVAYYDEHRLDQERATQIVCLMSAAATTSTSVLARRRSCRRSARTIVQETSAPHRTPGRWR